METRDGKTSSVDGIKALIYTVTIALIYFVFAKSSLLFAFEHTNSSPIWPATGIAFAIIFRLGYRYWVGIFLGAFLANYMALSANSIPVLHSITIALVTAGGNTLEAVVGVYAVRKFMKGSNPMNTVRDTLVFVFLFVFCSTMISATVGTISFFTSQSNWSGITFVWLTWWIGDAIGGILIAPLLLLWKHDTKVPWTSWKVYEVILLISAIVIFGILIFHWELHLEYLVIPLMLWSTFRFTRLETSFVTLGISIASIYMTIHGAGPFNHDSLNQSLLMLQSFTGMIALSTLVLSVAVAERKTIINSLRQSEERFRSLVENANSIIIRWNPDGVMSFINTYGLQIFGYKQHELVGRSLIESISPETNVGGRNTREVMDDITENPRALEHHVQEYIKKDNARVFVEWNIQPLYNNVDDSIEFLGIGTDITERRRAEEQIQELLKQLQLDAIELEKRVAERTADLEVAKVKAESADKLKSAFLAAMSHELRTPLNSILGFTGILLAQKAGQLNEEQTRQLGMVKNSAQHLLSLINDVLDLSKIEAGQMTVQFSEFVFKNAIYNVVLSLQHIAEKKGLTLNVDISPDIGILVSDKRKFEQVVLNLVNNAIKFTNTGEVKVLCRLDGENIEVEVADTGIGIPEADLETIFSPFRQLDNSLARTYEGSGLGLSICKGLVDKIGGKIRVQSRVGVGSSFMVSIPVNPARSLSN